MGSIKDWIDNHKYLKITNVTDKVLICETESNAPKKFETTNMLVGFDVEDSMEDILDLSSYCDLNEKCNLFLDIENEGSLNDEISLKKKSLILF